MYSTGQSKLTPSQMAYLEGLSSNESLWDDMDILDGASITALLKAPTLKGVKEVIKKNIGLDILIVTLVFLTIKKKF